jgi:hypothetical protein
MGMLCLIMKDSVTHIDYTEVSLLKILLIDVVVVLSDQHSGDSVVHERC